MKCPACGNTMTEMSVGKATVQACKGGCGGLWFEEFALEKVDEPAESAGEALLNVEQNPSVKTDPTKRYNCPRHPEMVMMRHFWSVKRDLLVDECPKCKGIFLDPGELAQIRGAYKTDAERRDAAKAYYSELFDKQLAQLAATDKSKAESARKVANAFKFICPSYYVPGKQEWGAF